MFIASDLSDDLKEYNLTNAFDVSTAVTFEIFLLQIKTLSTQALHLIVMEQKCLWLEVATKYINTP